MNKIIQSNPVLSLAATALFAHKIENPVLIDLRRFSALTYEYLIICTCQSAVQMRAILHNTRRTLNRGKVTGIRIECSAGVKWGILDCGDLIIHVFERNTRNYYSLERLWADAKIIELNAEDFISETVEEIEEDEFL